MAKKDDDEIRKSIKKYVDSLPESERNNLSKEDFERLIERAAQPLPPKLEKPPHDDNYTDTQTH